MAEQQILESHREDIFRKIRDLDSGVLDTEEFREEINNLGVELPKEVDRLLIHYDQTGAAEFSDFVRGFDRYFKCISRGDVERLKEHFSSTLRSQGVVSIARFLLRCDLVASKRNGALFQDEFVEICQHSMDVSERDCIRLFAHLSGIGSRCAGQETVLDELTGKFGTMHFKTVRRIYTLMDSTTVGVVPKKNVLATIACVAVDAAEHKLLSIDGYTVKSAFDDLETMIRILSKGEAVPRGEFEAYCRSLWTFIGNEESFREVMDLWQTAIGAAEKLIEDGNHQTTQESPEQGVAGEVGSSSSADLGTSKCAASFSISRLKMLAQNHGNGDIISWE